MKIGIIGSMNHAEKMIEVRDALRVRGHDAFLTNLIDPFVGRDDAEKDRIKLEQEETIDVIREFWDLMQDADAVVVVNIEKRGIPNYIGGNTLMEIGFAHVLGQKIFLLNPIPNIPFYEAELASIRPTILSGDLDLIG